jgi:hypothetical protein
VIPEQSDLFAQSSHANIAASGSAGARVGRLRGEIPEHPVFRKASGPGVKYFAQLALYPYVLELATSSAMATPPGFTSDDVVDLAREHRIEIGDASDEQRSRSWIGPWLRGLARRNAITQLRGPHELPIKRPSARAEAHGNPQYVYTAART